MTTNIEDLYIELPEPRLYNDYCKMNNYKGIVYGDIPPNFSTHDIYDNMVDFTENFWPYMQYNKRYLWFPYARVYTPIFNIAVKETTATGYIIRTVPLRIYGYKAKSSVTDQFLANCNNQALASFYDKILTEFNLIMSNRLDKQLYLYKIQGIFDISASIYSFIFRYAIGSIGTIIK